MVDSESVAVGGEVAAWFTDLLVLDESCDESEQAQRKRGRRPEDGTPAVALEAQLGLAGPNVDFDSWRTGPSDPCRWRSCSRTGRKDRAHIVPASERSGRAFRQPRLAFEFARKQTPAHQPASL